MGAWAVHFKATYLQMRMYIWGVVGLILLGRLADFIVSLFSYNRDRSILSDGNVLILILLFIAVILPLRYYKRIVHLGASREHYYRGLHFVFAVWAAAIACFNTLWYELETGVIRNYMNTVDLIEAFHWVDFGLVGSFLYQTAFYMMVMALLCLLVSGYFHPAGWLLWVLVLVAVPVGTAIPSLREQISSFFITLLANESLPAGVGFNLLLYAVFAAGGWLFTKRRAH